MAANFHAGRTWTLFQSNGVDVKLNLTQNSDGQLFGSATTSAGPVGTLDNGAAVTGEDIFFVIAWSDGKKGRYQGRRGADHQLSGDTFNVFNPGDHSTWATQEKFD
ncbi:MAG: hypothetical protein HOZ81_55240 [Streptomyces sp.]|nr:hypothetical protein [Streptomyces sp.]NUT27535.1 hypothetical protein [Streptomyces sp.]